MIEGLARRIERITIQAGWMLRAARNAARERIGPGGFLRFMWSRWSGGEHDLHLLGLTFPNAGPILWRQVFHLFLLDEYSPPGYQVEPGDTVVDIGANMGAFVALSACKGASAIHAFEPDEDNFAYLTNFVARNDLEGVHIWKKAVSASRGRVRLFKSPRSTRHSILGEDTVTGQRLSEFEEVDSIRLQDVLSEFQRVDLLKMDCEGAEFEIILDTPAGAMGTVERIVIEYHDHRNSTRVSDLLADLQRKGFVLEVEPNVFGKPNGLIFGSLRNG